MGSDLLSSAFRDRASSLRWRLNQSFSTDDRHLKGAAMSINAAGELTRIEAVEVAKVAEIGGTINITF